MISEKTSDRYRTPLSVMGRIRRVWLEGVDLDPFHEPGGHVDARHVIDCRDGGDAYALDCRVTLEHARHGRKMFANGPYSGKFPQMTAELCARYAGLGGPVFNLCPAAVGSEYWRRLVWPHASCVVWLGRLGFEAAVDIVNKAGDVTCPKGITQAGNRTEIALVGYRVDGETTRQAFADIAHTTVTR